MNEKTMNGKKLFKVALPVIIGLVLICLITVVISVVSRPDFNATISNANGIYVKLDGYGITNEKLYGNLRYSYGVTDMLSYVDKILLKGEKVDRNSDEYNIFKLELMLGEDYEDLTDEEVLEKKEEYFRSLAIAGYNTEEEINEYFDLEYRRTNYAKKAYKEWVKNHPYNAETLESAYLEMNAAKYKDSVDAIVVTFDSAEEAKAILELFGVDTSEDALKANSNWINKEKNDKRIAWYEELEAKNAALKTEKDDAKKKELEAEIAQLEENLSSLGLSESEWKKDVYFTEVEVQQIFIDMYNFMNAFYNGGDASNYYDENGKLQAKYNILLENTHYKVVNKKESDKVFVDESVEEVNKDFIEIIKNVSEEAINANCKLTYTSEEATAINSALNTTLFSTLKLDKDHYFYSSYTQEPKAFSGNGTYFLAALLNKYEAPELEYDFDDEVATGKTAPSQEVLDEITAYLLEEKFNDDIVTQMLLDLRAENNFVIYDNFLEGMYKAAWDYLYTTTLKMTAGEYPEYTVNKKNSKTLVFALGDDKVTADTFFEMLEEAHGPQTTLSLMANHFVLSNPKYNTLYNHETGEIYDKEAFKEAFDTNVKNIKYYFSAGMYASSGFDSDYGWDNFLKDYLRMDNENELVLNAAGLDDAFKKFYEDQYSYATVLEKMKEIYTNDYYSLKVINVLVYTDYNHDGSPDTYELEGAENEFWTEQQETLAKKLIEELYKNAAATGQDGLYNQLDAVAKEYNEATYNDEKWGVYKKHGLKAKVENEASYTEASSLVEEFHDKMFEVYKEIEKEGQTGIKFDAPYQVDGSFVTSYGYHKVAITESGDRAYATSDPDKTLGFEELRDSQLALLTENLYKLYLEMQEEDYEANKAEILKELGFAEDYVMDTYLQGALQAYYLPAIEELENETEMDLTFSYMRETAVKEGKIVFTNTADKEYYLEIEAIVRANLEKQLEEEHDHSHDHDHE